MKLTQIRIARQVRPTKNDKQLNMIYLRIFVRWDGKGKDFILSSRVSINKNQWNDTKKAPIGNSIESRRINNSIQKLENEVYSLFDEYNKTTKTPSVNNFKTYINKKLTYDFF